MAYYNYHRLAKNLILSRHCMRAELKSKHNNISPALVLYFDNHKPMPMREKCFYEYIALLGFFDVPIINLMANVDS